MEYKKAAQIRKKGLFELIAENKFSKEKSIGASIGGAISDKMKAKAVGIKEKFDPLNMVKALTGDGFIGKSIRTVAGRAMGRSEEHIRHFGGYGSRKRKLKETKDPLFTTIGSGAIVKIKSGDSISNILAKMYSFMEKNHETRRLNTELEDAFRKEQLDEDERRHKKLIESILNKKPTAIPEDDGEKEKSFIEKLLDGIKSLLKDVFKFITSLSGLLLPIMSAIAGTIISVIASSGGLIFKILLEPIKLLIGTMITALVKSLLRFAAGTPLAIPLAAFLGAVVAAEVIQEEQETKYGPKHKALQEKQGEELRALPGSDKAIQNMTDDERKQYKTLREKHEKENKASIAEFEKETLTPAMEKIGFKPSGEKLEDGSSVYVNKKGEKAGFSDYKTAISGPDWQEKLLMKLIVGEEKTAKEIGENAVNQLIQKGKDAVESKVDEFKNKLPDFSKPNASLEKPTDIPAETAKATNDTKSIPESAPTKNIPDMLPDNFEVEDGEWNKPGTLNVYGNNSQNTIGGGPAKMVDGSSTPVRNLALQKHFRPAVV